MAKRLDIVEEKFLNTVKENNLIDSGEKIVVGVSGGPDSLTLLSLLLKYKEKFNIEIIVAHINHLIRKDSTEDEQFVENFCEKNGVNFYCKRVNVLEIAKKEKKGTEEVGRKERYKFFREICEKENASKIAIAHNMNDNAETMILNLVRGTGLNGLEGIKPFAILENLNNESMENKFEDGLQNNENIEKNLLSKSKENSQRDESLEKIDDELISQIENEKKEEKNILLIRPLINCKREEIEFYCKKNNLEPRIDSTNKENIYKRNIIRNKILPSLKELNPNIVETLMRTSELVTENNDFMKEETYKAFLSVAEVQNKGTIEESKNLENNNCNKNIEVIIYVKKFNNLPIILRKNVLLLTIEKITGNTKNISKQNLDDITKMSEKNVGNKRLTADGLKFFLNNGILFIKSI